MAACGSSLRHYLKLTPCRGFLQIPCPVRGTRTIPRLLRLAPGRGRPCTGPSLPDRVHARIPYTDRSYRTPRSRTAPDEHRNAPRSRAPHSAMYEALPVLRTCPVLADEPVLCKSVRPSAGIADAATRRTRGHSHPPWRTSRAGRSPRPPWLPAHRPSPSRTRTRPSSCAACLRSRRAARHSS